MHKGFSTVPTTQQVTTAAIISAVVLSLPIVSLSLSSSVQATWELCQQRQIFLTEKEAENVEMYMWREEEQKTRGGQLLGRAEQGPGGAEIVQQWLGEPSQAVLDLQTTGAWLKIHAEP